MSVSKNIRIKIVLLMAKFESATVVQRKLSAKFGKNTPGLTCIKDTFERFCETGTIEDRERSGRPSEITESISKETLCNVFSNISKRMDLCISVDGNHFEHLL